MTRLILLGDGSRGLAPAVAREFAAHLPAVECLQFPTAQAAASALATMEDDDDVPLIVATSEVGNIDAAIATLAYPATEHSWVVVVTDLPEHDDLVHLVHDSRLMSLNSVPLVDGFLSEQCSVLIERWFETWAPNDVPDFVDDFTPEDNPLLTNLGLSNEEIVALMVEAVEKTLGPRPRLLIPEGTNLTTQNKPVHAIYVILDGSVALHRDSAAGDILLHHATSGPIIGLVAMARAKAAFFTSTTTTPVVAIRVSHEQLERVLNENPHAAPIVAALSIQALTNRLVRAEHLHVENHELAEQLLTERNRLEKAIAALEAARAKLVESTRLAMLGELSAGIAHELNNPVAALRRAAEYLDADISAILESSPATLGAAHAAHTVATAAALPTSAERALAKEFAEATGADRNTARTAVGLGITDLADFRSWYHADAQARHITELGAHIGLNIRNIGTASERITNLVASLKTYARPEDAPKVAVDIADGIGDCIRLTNHRMRAVTLDTDFSPVPPVLGHPSKLEQVWTNILINAVEAMEEAPGGPTPDPHITITLDQLDEWVRVRIADNGPGIPPDVQSRIFEPHFTTKSGQVRYGLGMGMSISRSIISDHGGTLTVESVPGRTVFTALLPTLKEEQ